jgi:hypothetical protein
VGRIDDLTGNTVLDTINRRLADLEARDPLSNSAVSGGRTRFIGEDSFLIEGSGGVTGTLTIDGLEIVDGELRIRGHLNVSGPTNLGGDTDITGDTTVTGRFTLDGPASIDGDTDITGTLHITGDTTVEGPFRVQGPMGVYGKLGIHGDTNIDGDTTLDGDLEVTGGGTISLGDMVLKKVGSRGKVDFGIAELSSDGANVAIQAGSALAGVGSGIAQLTVGGHGFRVEDDGRIRIGILPTTTRAPNLFLDPNTLQLFLSTATVGTGTPGTGGDQNA